MYKTYNKYPTSYEHSFTLQNLSKVNINKPRHLQVAALTSSQTVTDKVPPSYAT